MVFVFRPSMLPRSFICGDVVLPIPCSDTYGIHLWFPNFIAPEVHALRDARARSVRFFFAMANELSSAHLADIRADRNILQP